MELICLGDSLTFGYGVRPAVRWTALAGSVIRITNMGLCGDTTGGMLERLCSHVLTRPEFSAPCASRPDVLIMGGSNDIFYSGSDICARSNIGAMLHRLRAFGIEPIMGIPLPVAAEYIPEGWSSLVELEKISEKIDAYRSWLRRFCTVFDATYADFGADFLRPDGSVISELYLDGIHPNERGHVLMAQRLLTVLHREDAKT